MGGVNQIATAGFGAASEAYERGRPSYPRAVVDIVCTQLGLTRESVVLDLAAGTGKFTELLVARDLRVVAVEPVDEMRARLIERLPSTDVRAGSAERIPFGDASVDAVTVAQAFHWFDTTRAVAEIARVLRPGGGVALVWNRRLLDAPVQKVIEAIVAPHRGDTPSHRTSSWRETFAATGSFDDFTSCEIPHSQMSDRDGLVDRVLSTSFIAALAPADRATVAREVCDAIDRLGLGEQIVVPYHTEVHTARKSARA
ncbi:MAG TPA: methyltransferase domain-containing protein [Acidimicrobiales bacterium]|jgi:SAM-dependent methyltransferase|nr:methyltransferase domain-containing protein [Acidimicrobiales bacterium]